MAFVLTLVTEMDAIVFFIEIKGIDIIEKDLRPGLQDQLAIHQRQTEIIVLVIEKQLIRTDFHIIGDQQDLS